MADVGGQSSRWLAIYLRNHEAAARAGADLFARAARGQADRPWGPALADLADEVAQDLVALQRLRRSRHVRPPSVSGLVLQVGERVGRLKPNGRLLRRSPLTDLVEVEAALDAVDAKAGGWRALRAAHLAGVPVDLDELERRAEDQMIRLRTIHVTVAAAVL